MNSAPRIATLLLVLLLTLSACAAQPSIASAPVATPTLTVRQQAIESAPSDQAELVSGHYQLLMFYSPL